MNEEDFYAGIIYALCVIKSHDAETIFHEVVDSVDTQELIRHARKYGQMRWSGLSKYGYGGYEKELQEAKIK